MKGGQLCTVRIQLFLSNIHLKREKGTLVMTPRTTSTRFYGPESR